MITQPRPLLKTSHYTEGVCVDERDGAVFFSMTAIGVVMRFEPGAERAEVWAHVAAPNGHTILADGTHVLMSSTGAILHLDATGRISDVIATKLDGRWLTYPNDVAVDAKRGGYYVTDSGYKSMPKHLDGTPQGRLYRVEADRTVREVASGIAYANGLVLTRDGAWLYVGESCTRKIWRYPIGDDGSLGTREWFADAPREDGRHAVPDGFTLGGDGKLYVAHYNAREVLVYDPAGNLVDRLPSGNKTTSHCAFTPDGSRLYVSGGIEDEAGPGAIFEIAA